MRQTRSIEHAAFSVSLLDMCDSAFTVFPESFDDRLFEIMRNKISCDICTNNCRGIFSELIATRWHCKSISAWLNILSNPKEYKKLVLEKQHAILESGVRIAQSDLLKSVA